ncbi:MAG: winged helix-turn-helix domain-containing protein [Muribaculaceae bacterium]
MLKELNPLLHSQLRLAVMSILMNVEEADFVYIKKATNSTAGNLSSQIEKLRMAGYVDVRKSFVGKKPCTSCSVTPFGKEEFEIYVDTIKDYLEIRR